MSNRPIRIAIIDDSIFMRTMLRKAFAGDSGFEVIATASNGNEGLALIRREKPDVATLDLEMPVGGMHVLESLGKQDRTAVVVVSTKTQRGADATVAALEAGAVGVVAKPLGKPDSNLETFFEQVRTAVRDAAGSRRTDSVAFVRPSGEIPTDMIVAIGISAGGPQMLHQLLPALPVAFPPVVITQHMPVGFTQAFADRLNQKCQQVVEEAKDGRLLEPGLILIAPGDAHLRFTRQKGALQVQLSRGPKVSGFRPSVDAMFDSLAELSGERTVGLVMTGMGSDGAMGVRLLKKAGGVALAQDEASSVVYGMPKAAFETGCVEQVVGLKQIPLALAEAVRRLRARQP